MAVRKISLKGEPVLHRRAEEVRPEYLLTKEFKALVEDMVETMYANNGVGIAAPQVGVSLRLFIAQSSDGPVALVNPVFTDKSWKTTRDEEGCLSVPGTFGTILRSKSLNVRALSVSGDSLSFKAEGYFARILQHEMDHLDGILIVDRMKQQERDKGKKK